MTELLEADLVRLRALVGRMISASAEYDAPAADDPLIFNDIVGVLGPNLGRMGELLDALDEPDLARLTTTDIGAALQQVGEARAWPLISAVMQCYYRDGRVMRSLGMEPRPPFPQGYEVEGGDWSLLDPVRARSKLWREA